MKYRFLFLLVSLGAFTAGCCEAQVNVTNTGTVSHSVEFEDNGERTLEPGESYLWTLTWNEDGPGDTSTQIRYWVDGADCGTYHIWDGETDRELNVTDNYVRLGCSG